MSEIERRTPEGAALMLDPVTDSWTSVVEDVGWLAAKISHTEFVPAGLRGRDGSKVAAAILTGRELGLPPMTALQSIHVINGKPGISAEMMRALVLQAGHEIVLSDVSSQKVTIKGRRENSQEWTTVTWTAQDAARAGLRGGNYDKYPRQMLTARATTELCRLIFADVIHGLRSIEELDELGADEIVVGDVPEPDEPAAAAGARTVARKRTAAKVQPVDADAQGEQPKTKTTQRRRPTVTKRGAKPAPSVVAEQSGTDDPPASEPQPHGEGEGVAVAVAPSPVGEDDVHEAEIVEDEPPAEVEPVEDAEPRITEKQRNLILVRFEQLEITDRGERLWTCSQIVGRQLESANDMTRSEAGRVIDELARCQTRGDVELVVEQAQKEQGQ